MYIQVCYNARIVFSFRSIRPWGLLIFALLLTTLAVKHGADVIVWLAILVCFAASIFDFFAIPLQRGQQKREERRRHRINQLQQERLARVETRLLAGELVRLEEWWEDDDLWIDENAHILFVFGDGEEMDFVLYKNIATDISRLLATQGICWQASIRFTADSHIIWQR